MTIKEKLTKQFKHDINNLNIDEIIKKQRHVNIKINCDHELFAIYYIDNKCIMTYKYDDNYKPLFESAKRRIEHEIIEMFFYRYRSDEHKQKALDHLKKYYINKKEEDHSGFYKNIDINKIFSDVYENIQIKNNDEE